MQSAARTAHLSMCKKRIEKKLQKLQQRKTNLQTTAGEGGAMTEMEPASDVQTLAAASNGSQQELAALVDLQRRLAASGFRLLKPGGYMVYSTCSLCVEQNEEVVEWLMHQCSRQGARLVPVADDCFGHHPSFKSIRESGLVKESKGGMLTFLPNTNSDELSGGGFFMAKIQKRALGHIDG